MTKGDEAVATLQKMVFYDTGDPQLLIDKTDAEAKDGWFVHTMVAHKLAGLLGADATYMWVVFRKEGQE